MFESLYIHVPFCRKKCAYCGFYSEVGAGKEEKWRYVQRLREELLCGASKCGTLHSIFVGGGTPSVLQPEEWRPVLDCIREHYTFAEDLEWSMEANPESLSSELIALWGAYGVNRISMGVQAFQEALRRTIGRNGSLERLPEIMEALAFNGIRRYNLDLIYNIPGQSPAQWQESLEKALAFHPTHVSCYALTIEEGTRLSMQKVVPSDEDFLSFWNLADSVLSKQGLRRYEISNFAVPGQECRHNLEIWKGATYLGCGPAASSFDGRNRWTNPPSLSKWLNGEAPEMDILAPRSRAAEILAFGMRVVQGWDWTEFQQRTGYDPWELRGDALRKLLSEGLLEPTRTGAKPTPQGLLFNDDIAMALL